MIKIELNGKRYEMPESWDEITMKQYCNLFYNLDRGHLNEQGEAEMTQTMKNEAVIISRLLGEDDGFVEMLPLQVFAMLQHHAMFIYDISEFIDSKIFYLNIDGKRYFMPSPNEMSLRQYIDADMIMRDEGRNQFIELLACLLLPIGKDGKMEYDGKYNDLIPKIENMKASDGLPFIYTFFKKKEISKKLSEDCSKALQAADRQAHHTQGS